MSQAVSPASGWTSAPNVTTLRTLIDRRRAQGDRFKLAEVVATIVPICTDLSAMIARGETVFVYGGSIGAGQDGVPRIVPELGRVKPTQASDLAAIAPEALAGAPKDARAAIFSLGALVYEMLTLQPIGAGMQPPTAIVPSLPPLVDTILAKALITDPSQRPSDLLAFAQALHHFAPTSTLPPPAGHESGFEVEVDMRSSMLPSANLPAAKPVAKGGRLPSMEIHLDELVIPKAPAAPRINDDPFAAVVDTRAPTSDPQRVSQNRATEELASLKARLESDPAPRWMMVKDKMDHGPFAAIELLQMIASDRFVPDDVLVDTHNGKRCPLKDHPEFSRFAHHANLKRENVKETKAVAQAQIVEKRVGALTGTFALIGLGAAVAIVSVVVWRIRASHAEDERGRQQQEESLAAEGSVNSAKTAKPKPSYAGGPGYGSGQSFADAVGKNVDDIDAESLIPSECKAPVSGTIPGSCGFDGDRVDAQIAVQNGVCKGASVTTSPPNASVSSCIASRIRGLHWRSVPGMSRCLVHWGH